MIRKAAFFLLIGVFAFLLFGCTIRSKAYYDYYAHLRCSLKKNLSDQRKNKSDYFLVILVDACHLDYFEAKNFLKSVAKHPSDGSKTGSVGHAWIYLQGPSFVLEGGHSGEGSDDQVSYFDGVMDYHEKGMSNPICYLWKTLQDGFFQKGAGGHFPTCAAKINLTKQQFQDILKFIDPNRYSYRSYGLTKNQCVSFVKQVAAFADLHLETKISISIPSKLIFRGAFLSLWTDSKYQFLTLSSPDVLEKSLIQLIKEGRAENALSWYKAKKGKKKRFYFSN